jgi:outer membrane protein assembly factor BamB
LVDNGTAYVAAGIVNDDGTHVYALNAVNGRIKWQNNTSGHRTAFSQGGVAVQGYLLLWQDVLYLAGGNMVPAAAYDVKDGIALRTRPVDYMSNRYPEHGRGSELYVLNDGVMTGGHLLYSDPENRDFDGPLLTKTFQAISGDRTVLWVTKPGEGKITCYHKGLVPTSQLPEWGEYTKRPTVWQMDCADGAALAVGKNGVVVGKSAEIVCLDINTGKILWQVPVASPVLAWGLAVSARGEVIATLENGRVVCLGNQGE